MKAHLKILYIPIAIGALLLTTLPLRAQYFQALYDIDSSQDFGWNIFLQPDSNYFIIGGSQFTSGYEVMTFTQISADGNSVLSRHILSVDSASIYQGLPGQVQKLPDGGYIIPITIQYPNPVTGYLYSAAGFLRVNDTGGIVFMKTYTDTSIHFDIFNTCAIMPDGGFLGGGEHALNTPSNNPGLLIRTDSLGDTLWTHTYQKNADEEVWILTVAPLSGNRILVGAMSIVWVYDKYGNLNMNQPWFLVLDSMGNVLKDTLYNYPPYGGGGAIYKDKNRGYFHSGNIVYPFDASEPFPFSDGPCYVAYLDTNFRLQWFTLLSYDTTTGYFERFPETLFQLNDGNVLAIGESAPEFSSPAQGWAAKFDRTTGTMLWQHLYTSDTVHDSYIRGVIEKPNGNLVFTGTSMNDTLPAWNTNEDLWLIGTDSNGCQVVGCSPDTATADTTTAVRSVENGERGAVVIYPNPTDGNVAIKTSGQGTFVLYSIEGQVLRQYSITAGETNLVLPPGLAAGVYIGVFSGSDGGRDVVRLVCRP